MSTLILSVYFSLVIALLQIVIVVTGKKYIQKAPRGLRMIAGIGLAVLTLSTVLIFIRCSLAREAYLMLIALCSLVAMVIALLYFYDSIRNIPRPKVLP